MLRNLLITCVETLLLCSCSAEISAFQTTQPIGLFCTHNIIPPMLIGHHFLNLQVFIYLVFDRISISVFRNMFNIPIPQFHCGHFSIQCLTSALQPSRKLTLAHPFSSRTFGKFCLHTLISLSFIQMTLPAINQWPVHSIASRVL